MQRRWWALVAVSLATFMTYLDNNVVNVALPTIQRELGLTISGLEWIVSGYILVFAGLLMAGGRLADVFGRRRVFLAGVALFTLASAAAGLSGDGTALILSRAAQGVGAALLAPSALALLSLTFPDARERGIAVGVWSAIGGLALALGPVTGGFVSENWHWGWIFLINVPIGVITMALAAWSIGRAGTPARRRLDLPGLATSSAALFALTYALIEGDGEGWTSAPILGAFALAAVAAATFVLLESRSREPMMDLSLFRDRVFSGGTLAMGLWAFGVFGIYFFTALWLQNVLGFSPTEAGAAFVPMALLMAALATVAPRIAARLGTAVTVAAGLGAMAVAIAAMSTIGRHGTYMSLFPWLMLYGLGAGMLVPLTSAILGALPAERAGLASGVLNVSREVFGLLGVTVLGAVLSARASASAAAGAAPLTAFLDGYRLSLIVAAAIVAVGVPVSLVSLRTRRADAVPASAGAAREPAGPAPEPVPEPVA
ncbi:MFS transporter [Sphaerisporangium sp. NPDC005289]|uniref:MFS transporter n=1 Tax=Sphaerisporangium sp. NPDC005289 TaxID=3155247 RepID=UPI00339F5865